MLRELDHRISDGQHVALYWDPADDTIWLQTVGQKGGSTINEIEPDKARDAFLHPSCYT